MKMHLIISSAKWQPFCLGEIPGYTIRCMIQIQIQIHVLSALLVICYEKCHTVGRCDGCLIITSTYVNTLRPRQNGRRFADDTFKRIFLNENVRISIKISLKFVPKGPINNNPALVQIMAWRRPGDKPLSEPMMVSLSTHICVTRP